MSRVCVALILTLAWMGVSSGTELIENGDFEGALSPAWTQQGSGGGISYQRDVAYHSDPDYEAYSRKYLTGWCALKQTVNVSTVNLLFTAELRPSNFCEINSYEFFAASAVRIEYQNSMGGTLGETRIYSGTENCNWTSSSTLHCMEVEDGTWSSECFVLEDELSRNLPGVNPANVAKIAVSLYCYCTDYC
jgi:hypothetical protein